MPKQQYEHVCNGLCEECSLQRHPHTHAREYDGIVSDIKHRETVSENPSQIEIPLSENGELQLTVF